MGLKHGWKDSDWGVPKYFKKILSWRHIVHQKSHIDWPVTETGSSRCSTSNWPPETWHRTYI